MQKRPLNLVKDNFRIFNNHSNSNMNVAPFVVALVHIKFCSDLKKRFKMVSVEQNHYRRGLHYFQLSYALRRLAGRSLIYDGSIKLQSSDDLLRAGLIGKVPASIWSTEEIGDAVVE